MATLLLHPGVERRASTVHAIAFWYRCDAALVYRNAGGTTPGCPLPADRYRLFCFVSGIVRGGSACHLTGIGRINYLRSLVDKRGR